MVKGGNTFDTNALLHEDGGHKATDILATTCYGFLLLYGGRISVLVFPFHGLITVHSRPVKRRSHHGF